jgi:glycosyltransferase involved in cell wall biosynthesis
MSVNFSVIICNYNNKDYLGRAIRSCLKQSLPKEQYEIIVVDDASTDKSNDVIVGFKDKIIPILLKENVGVAEASNIGIRSSLGTYVIRVDADDYISENTLLFMNEILNTNHDIGFVYSDHLQVDKEENIIERVNLNTLDALYRHGAGIAFRKSYLEAIGLYDATLRNAEDYDLLKRYIKNFNGYHLRIPLYRYRRHDNNMTNDEEERKKWETKSDDSRTKV